MISATTDTSKRHLLNSRQSNWNLALQMLSLRMQIKRNHTNPHLWQKHIQWGDSWHKPVPA